MVSYLQASVVDQIVFSDFKLFSGRSLASQENGWDCGMYSILIAHCVAFGRDDK